MLSTLLLAALLPCSLPSAWPQEGPGGEPTIGAESLFSTEPANSIGHAVPQDQTPPEVKNPEAAAAAARACDWLAAQQNADGSWSPAGTGAAVKKPNKPRVDDDDFWKRALEGSPTDDVPARAADLGDPLHSIGVTGLALLALMEDGSSMTGGRYREKVVLGVKYLVDQQDGESGLIGVPVGHAYHYDHAIATLALARVYAKDRAAIVAKKVGAAVKYIARARNPYRVWRYDNPPTGDNDSSITTWMTLALAEAQRGGLAIDEQAFPAVVEWFDEMTEKGTGRVGYTEAGSRSSRVPGRNVDFDTEPETLTAAGLISRLACGQTPRKDPVVVDHVRCILQALPSGEEEKLTDTLWFYFGTGATHQIGSRPWASWSKATVPLALAAQKTVGPVAGSFDPQAVAWGFATGRVGTTALMAAALHIASR